MSNFSQDQGFREPAAKQIETASPRSGAKKSIDFAEAYCEFVAQAILLIDADIAEKGHFWMENR